MMGLDSVKLDANVLVGMVLDTRDSNSSEFKAGEADGSAIEAW